MRKDDIFTGLDIGSTTIRVVIAQVGTHGQEGLHIIGAAENPSEGISKGNIVSIEDAVTSIYQTFEKAERMTGIPIEHALVSINGHPSPFHASPRVVIVATP